MKNETFKRTLKHKFLYDCILLSNFTIFTWTIWRWMKISGGFGITCWILLVSTTANVLGSDQIWITEKIWFKWVNKVWIWKFRGLVSVDKVNHEFLHRLVTDQSLDLVQDVLVQQQVDHMKRAWKMCLVVTVIEIFLILYRE